MLQIYLMKTDVFLENERFLQGCSLVDNMRLRKIQACKQTEDKVRSLCCGLLLQYAMKKQTGGKLPLDLRYEIGEHGKPYLADYPQLYFNLSHSGEYVVLAFANQEVGIDIQQKRPIKEALAKMVLSDREYMQYKGLPGEDACNWFFRCWCAKESYSKLNGTGLLQELGKISYEPETERICAENDSAFCREYQIGNDYYMNVCIYEKEVFPKEVTCLTFSHILS